MEAIILAGGMGTRLQKVIPGIPKPMAPVGGKPFLYYLFNWIKDYPIEKLILSVGYKAESIVEYFGKSFFDMPIDYVIEEKPLGTGGAVRYAFKRARGNDILILNGDTYFPININKFFSFHLENKSLFTVALKRMRDFNRYGTIELDNNLIMRFNEKKFCKDGLINGGIYLANRKYIESWQIPEVFSLEKDILEKDAGSSILKGMIFDDTFLDIGLPQDYSKAEMILTKYFQ